MKKGLSFLLALALLVSVCAPASAAKPGSAAGHIPESQVEHYAYMKLEGQPKEVQEKILQARRVIIFRSDGWVADGVESYVVDMATGEVVEGCLPKFSELFPGWDIPCDEPDPFDTGTKLMPLLHKGYLMAASIKGQS